MANESEKITKEEEAKEAKEAKGNKKAANGKKNEKKKEELTEEDLKLKEELEMLVQRLKETDVGLHHPALESLRTLIRTSTSSMTSVPKPLKFLRPHYPTLVQIHETFTDPSNKAFLSDILSVLAMTSGAEDHRETLKFKLIGSGEAISAWGHEYVRHLSAEVAQEYNVRMETEQPVDDLFKLAEEIVPFCMSHNAEADACDLLMELEAVDKLVQYVDENNYERVCLYLVSCVNYVPEPEDQKILQAVLTIYRQLNRYPESLLIALKMNNLEIAQGILESCPDATQKKQLSFLLARQQVNIDSGSDDLNALINSTNLSENFLYLARELEITDAKTPEDIYKSHLEQRPATTTNSALQNLASTFVNAFVNAGFGKDKLMVEDGNWLYKNKDHGLMSAAASLGMILLWDVEEGLAKIDKYLYSNDDNIKAGALLGLGIVNTGVKNEADPALALLADYVNDSKPLLRTSAINGLGLAYSGSQRKDVQELILPLITDTGILMEISCLAALSLGHIFVASCDGDITSSILETLMEREPKQLKDPFLRFMGLGLGLLYLGRGEAADTVLEALKAIPDPFGKQISVLLEICAYTGTGNVLKIQKMLHLCTDHIIIEKPEDKKDEAAPAGAAGAVPGAVPGAPGAVSAPSPSAAGEKTAEEKKPAPQEGDDEFQAFAVLGIALISLGEEIGAEMSLRSFNHLMHYGELVIRRVVPLALALLCVSNPQEINLVETLSKYSHDHDPQVAQSAIFAMGMVGAGTNNARLAQMLRQLASYYSKDPNSLFMVRIAQGLLHMGKGTISINPFHSHRLLWSRVGLAGLITVLLSLTISKSTILGKHHSLLYYLVTAMYPRMLITLDENLKPLPVSVRVGQALDTVGQAGRPKTITGFQTHTTPVLLATGERAELATEEYISLTKVLEGFVILKKNPDYVEPK